MTSLSPQRKAPFWDEEREKWMEYRVCLTCEQSWRVTYVSEHGALPEDCGTLATAKTVKLRQENFAWGTWDTLIYPVLSGLAGVCAGALGIAGGLIKVGGEVLSTV